jgi:hypothetical protein
LCHLGRTLPELFDSDVLNLFVLVFSEVKPKDMIFNSPPVPSECPLGVSSGDGTKNIFAKRVALAVIGLHISPVLKRYRVAVIFQISARINTEEIPP